MQTREHYVAGQAPDWRAAKPGHEAQVPGDSPEWIFSPEGRAWSKRCARRNTFKRAMRNYRRKVVPMAEEPRSLIDSWPFLVCFGIVVGILYVARSFGRVV